MSFVTAGLAVAGLVSVAVPIIIHLLFRRRRRPIEWAAMRLLMEALRRHRRRLQLQQLLLLVTRCLILALLGIALAQPLLEAVGSGEAGASRAVFLVIDNGLTASVQDDDRTALDQHLADATGIVESLDPGDLVGVITAARPAAALLAPPSSDHGAVVDLIEAIEPAESTADIAGAMTLLRSSLDGLEGDRSIVAAYLLSEFRLGSAPLDAPLPSILGGLPDEAVLLASPPASAPVPNVQITDVEPLRGLVLAGQTDGSGRITVRLARHGGTLDRDVTKVRLELDRGTAPPARVVQWEPGESEASTDFLVDLGSEGEGTVGVTAVIDDDRLQLDNRRSVVLDARSRIRATMIDPRTFGLESRVDQLSAGQWIRRALEPSERAPIEVIDVQPAALDTRDLRATDVAVLPRPDLLNQTGWAALRDFVDVGGLLIVTPPAEANVHLWADTFVETMGLPWRLALEVAEVPEGRVLAEEQPPSALLRLLASEITDLCRPVAAFRSLPVSIDPGQGEPVLEFADGAPFVLAGSPRGEIDARGLVLYLAAAPDLAWTNLPTQVLMVPLFQELVRQGLSLIRISDRSLVGDRPASSLRAATEYVAPEGERLVLDRSGRPRESLVRSGLYTVADAAAQPIGTIAVNIDPGGGRTEMQSPDAVNAWLGRSGEWQPFGADDPAAALRTADAASSLAGILLPLVLVLVLIETILARRFSYAYRDAGTETGDSGPRAAIPSPGALVGGRA